MINTKQNIERARFVHRVQGMMIAFVLFCVYVFVPSDAYADCVNPAGVRGQQVYNGTHEIMQFCNGTDWIAMRGGSYDPLSSLSCADNEIALWHGVDSEWKCGLDAGADDMGDHTATQNVDAAANNILNVNFLELEKVAGAAMPGIHGGGSFGGNGCSLTGGGSIPHGVSGTAYQAATVPFGSTCQSETRICNNGTLMSGTYAYGSCEVAAGGTCAIPWGGTFAHAGNITAYQASNVPFGSSCVSETRNCNNGTLSGSYTHESCVVDPADSTPDAFAFTGQTNVNPSITVYSNTIFVSGITVSTAVSITDSGHGTARFRVNGGVLTTSATLNNGDSVQIEMTSDGTGGTLRTATLDIGGVTDIWSVTTKQATYQAPVACTGGGCRPPGWTGEATMGLTTQPVGSACTSTWTTLGPGAYDPSCTGVPGYTYLYPCVSTQLCSF